MIANSDFYPWKTVCIGDSSKGASTSVNSPPEQLPGVITKLSFRLVCKTTNPN